jgi:hypothetical protein
MTIFSHIEHISHKYPMKVKVLHKWSYFHTLSIFYTVGTVQTGYRHAQASNQGKGQSVHP